MKKQIIGFILLAFVVGVIALAFYLFVLPYMKGIQEREGLEAVAKPVIYLYPQEETEVQVNLEFSGELTVTYPEYKNGWQVTAYPDGRIINHSDGREYSYLFWEGVSDTKYDFSSGFVVKGSETADFLREKLSYIGLTPREYNEFIVYWLPHMQGNAYNLISFQEINYEETAKLIVTPQPDSVLRIFMAYQPLDEAIYVPKQELKPFYRSGFTLIEWGGTQTNKGKAATVK